MSTTIQIVRNSAGNCINFVGSTNPVYWNACLSGQVDVTQTDTVNVINDLRSNPIDGDFYEFYRIPYTQWLDKDGVAFASAADVAAYITNNANVLGSTGTFLLSPLDTIDFTVDETGTTILLDTGDAFAVNSIQAVGNPSGKIDIVKHTGTFILYQDLELANATIDGALVPQVLVDAVNLLNTQFANAGNDSGLIPVITSSLAPTIVEGSTLNYELTADYGVGYEWSNLPSGVVVVEGNPRKLIGGSALTAGTYNITVKAINYYGEDTETIALLVSNPPFADTKSINFNTYDYLDAGSPAGLSSVLGRAGNGAGSGDAWTVSFWFKMGTYSGGAKQTMFFYGSTDYKNGGHIHIHHKGSSGAMTLQYGSKNNNLEFVTPNNTFTDNTWHHVMVTYDGGTTGSSSGSLSSYYSRFGVFVDGVLISTNNNENNFGWSAAMSDSACYIGQRSSTDDTMRSGCKIDELAIWGSDQTANVASIYNSGTTHDLSGLGTAPTNWWRMGDGDTYPTLIDSVGTVDLTMTNMTVAEIVSDVP